jgi:phosphatidylinositol alpha-mannosyltransferase
VATFHSYFKESLGYRFFRRQFQERLDRHAAVIAVSRSTIKAMSRYFEAEWDLIPNGVNVEYFHPNGRRPFDAFEWGPRLLFLGRLDPRNGLEVVLEAMEEILAHDPRTELWVAGDGPLLGYYKWRAAKLKGHVRFLGRVFDERPGLYGTADLYLCPTRIASFGITLLEAMASGTPLIASDNAGFRELAGDEDATVLVSANDPRAWSKAVIDLMSDPERRDAMSRAGLAKAALYSWPDVARRVAGVYDRVRQ